MHVFMMLCFFLCATQAVAQVPPQGPIAFDPDWVIDGITYIPLDVDQAGSNIWGSVGINPNGIVMVGVANHLDNVAIYTWDSQRNELRFEGNLMEMLHLPMQHWQSKIHSYIYWSQKHQKFYFGTDAGTYRSETIVEHPYGYRGGYWAWFDPVAHTMGILGLSGPHRSVKGAVYSDVSELLMGNTDPQQHFVTCNVATGVLRDYGRINHFYQPRVLFADQWGNGYTVDTYGELVKFDWQKQELIDLRVALPRAAQAKFWQAATGIVSAQMMPDGSVYGITYWGIAFHYIPAEHGPGLMEDLGPTFGPDTGGIFASGYSPNLAVIGAKMYYGIGGHGMFIDPIQKDVFLVEKDLQSTQVRVVSRLQKITEFTGSGVIDTQGNVYFGGHGKSIAREDLEAASSKTRETTQARAYLVKFNPQSLIDPAAKVR